MRFRHLTPSSRIRITPYSELIDAQGATSFTSYNNTLLATSFKSVNEDYWRLRRHVQLWDVSCEKQVEIVGVDAARLVQLMTPRDLSRAEVGQCLYVPLVDDSGGLINDPIVLKLAEDRFWLSISDSDVLLWAKGLAIGFSLDVLVFEPDVCPLAVQGPKAETLMALLFGDGVSELKHFQFSFFEFKGYPLLIARSGWRKQGGFEIYLDNIELAGILWESLWQCGEPLEVQAGCPNLIERIEGGLLSYGSDFNNRDNPLECRFEKYCDIDNVSTFIGRESLIKQRDVGITRRLMGVSFSGDPCLPLEKRLGVFDGSFPIGYVTSAVWSPSLKNNIGFVMINKSHWDIGTDVKIEVAGGREEGCIKDLPFLVPPL